MDRAELIARAAPACRDCDQPVQRVEIPWRQGDNGRWYPIGVMVCPDGHRVPVELL